MTIFKVLFRKKKEGNRNETRVQIVRVFPDSKSGETRLGWPSSACVGLHGSSLAFVGRLSGDTRFYLTKARSSNSLGPRISMFPLIVESHIGRT